MADEKVQLTVEAMLDGDSIGKLTKALASGVEKATTEGGKRAQKEYANYIKVAAEAGIRGMDGSKTRKEFLDKVLDANAMSARIQEAWEKGDKEHAKFLEGQRKKDMKHLKLLADRRKSNYADFARIQSRTMAEQADAFAGKLERGISGLFSGNIDLGGMIKGAGQAGQRRGDAAILKGNDPNATKRDKQMATLGKTMASIGTGLMAFGAVTGILTILVKAFVDLHDRVNDMNKAFSQTAGAADFGLGSAATSAAELERKMDSVRDSILEASKMDPVSGGWMQSSDDLYAILGAMNEMNFSFEKMKKNVDNNIAGLSSFADHAIRAVAYGKLLGVEGREMGQQMTQMANEFGVGLNVIAEGLHAVHREAMLSGFSTKRFYSTVLELTSGLGAYNVRLEEAANLLGLMGHTAGEGQAGEMSKKFGTGMESMSVEERLKKLLLDGGKDDPTTKRIFTDDAKASAAAFYKALKGNKDFDGTELLKMFGLDVGGGMDAFVKQFMKIKPGQRQKLRDVLFAKKTGLGDDAAEVSDLADRGVAKSAAGKGDQGRQVEAMSYLGPAAQMALRMQMPVVFKNVASSLGDLAMTGDTAAQAAAASASGMSLDDIQQIGALQSKMMSRFKSFGDMSEEQLNADGMTRTGKGKYRRRDQTTGQVSGDEFKDWLGLLLASNDEVEHMTNVVSEDTKIAKDISDKTGALSTVLKENIAAILNDIYIVVRDILNWLVSSSDKKKKIGAAGKKLISKFAGKQSEAQTALKSAQAAHKAAPTAATKSAVGAAQADVDKYTALKNAAIELDPADYNSYEEYNKAVYKKAGQDRPGSSKAPPGGRDKQEHSQNRRETDIRGKGIGEAWKEDGWGGVATWMAGMEGGIESYQGFKNYMDPFWQNSGIPKTDQKTFMDYWKELYLQNVKSDPGFASGALGANLTDERILAGAMDGIKAAEIWRKTASEGGTESLMGDMSLLTRDGFGPLDGTYRGFLSSGLDLDYHEDAPTRRPSGPVIPSAADDLFVPTNGRPVALNSADQVLAMKPGGAIDRALGGRGGGGGSPVTINIKWTGDEALVRRAVIEGINIARGKPFA